MAIDEMYLSDATIVVYCNECTGYQDLTLVKVSTFDDPAYFWDLELEEELTGMGWVIEEDDIPTCKACIEARKKQHIHIKESL